ncbi:hypothetical protein Trydic_g8330 [Trypoxylus dichotomus]
MEAKKSLYSAEIASITNRQVAVERIETAAETQMFVESVLEQRPKSPPLSQNLEPKVEIETEPLISSEKTDGNVPPSTVPRVITKVCVCTNSCCNADTGELCEDCPMRDLKRPKDYQKCKLKPVENSIPKRFGSPIITGVSVTINNPGKIREAVKDLFTQIPDKKTASALGSALVTAPKEPFTAVDSYSSTKPISLPQETEPYLPPERPLIIEPKPQTLPKAKPQAPDTPLVSALRIAPDRPFTPVNIPDTIKKKKPKEDPLLKDLPKPVQWMSMVSALTTAPERPYSPFVTESSIVKETVTSTVSVEEINKIKESQQKIMSRSVHNETALPKPYTQPPRLEKFEPINDSKVIPELHFPPVSDELKREYGVDYSKANSQTSTQIIEETHIDISSNEDQDRKRIKSSEIRSSANRSNEINEHRIIEKQTEETISKKPLELAGCLQKREYLPQYQMALNYEETIQLPHHKDIKKLLDNQKKQTVTQSSNESLSSTQHLKETSSHYLTASSKQVAMNKTPTVTIQSDRGSFSTQEVIFEPVREDKSLRTTSSPRPRSLTPSMINKPAPILPYYQENLVATQLPPPDVNILDPKSPNISRSPSPCPYSERPSSPFGRLTPRAVSPAAGPPPNPLKTGELPRKITQGNSKIQEAKKNISEYIPQYQEKVDGIEVVPFKQSSKKLVNINVATDSKGKVQPKYSQSANASSDILKCSKQIKIQENSSQSITSGNLNLSRNRKVDRNEKVIENKRASLHPFENVKDPNITEPNVTPVHITNPQSITSPFISLQKDQKQSECVLKNRSACSISNQPNVKQQDPSLTKHIPCISVNTPIVSYPNVGAGGGRQAGAIGVAPKRGRGILNVGGLIGSRIPMCGHCHGHIRGPFITALGKIWCPEHFICNTASCKRPLQDLGFVEEQGQLYCEYCFEQYLAPPCAKCGSKIKGDCLKAIGKNFHPECFSCSYCGKLFGNSPFFLEDGQPYCENDWNELFTTKCFACGFPVEAGDRWVEALNNNYHSQCFNCTMCKKNLEGQSFFAKGGRPFCKNHAR